VVNPSTQVAPTPNETFENRLHKTAMNYDEAKAKLIEVITARLTAAGKDVPRLEETTSLLGGSLPLDSLELAVIVISMGEFTGNDPFASGFIEFQTIGELARLYAN
jgi:hypothetical protein